MVKYYSTLPGKTEFPTSLFINIRAYTREALFSYISYIATSLP